MSSTQTAYEVDMMDYSDYVSHASSIQIRSQNFQNIHTFSLSSISLYIFATKTGGAIAPQPPCLPGACSSYIKTLKKTPIMIHDSNPTLLSNPTIKTNFILQPNLPILPSNPTFQPNSSMQPYPPTYP